MKNKIFITTVFILLNCMCYAQIKDFVFTDTIQSKYFEESKVIQIYLPPDYYNTKDEFPLQVVLGGFSRTRLYYSMNEYLSKTYQILDLNHLHTIPESIIVGLSTAPRNSFEDFKNFIENEVIPYIDSNYRKTGYKSLIGHSSDGEFVLYNLFSNNSLFQGYFCTAPTNSENFVKQLNNKKNILELVKSPKRLFLGASQRDYFYTENIELIEAFNNVENRNFSFKSSIKTIDTHHTVFPVLIMEALSFIYNDWYFCIPKLSPEKTTELFVKHYEQLSHSIGFEIVPPEFDFYLLAYILDSRKHIYEKIELLKNCKEFYPEAENADAYLGRSYYMIGDLLNAKKHSDIALTLNPANGFAKQTMLLINEIRE